MQKLSKVFVLAVGVLLISSAAFAASPWTEEDSYAEQALAKLIFGAKNLLGGWTELLTVPIDYDKEGKTVIEGVGKGLYNAAVYTIGGAIHAGTFFVTNWDVPLPDNGVQL